MGPCTFLVTAMVTGDQKNRKPIGQLISETWKKGGFKGFYPGGSAIAFRQATNWASRQGFTDAMREVMRRVFHDGDATAKLTVGQEIIVLEQREVDGITRVRFDGGWTSVTAKSGKALLERIEAEPDSESEDEDMEQDDKEPEAEPEPELDLDALEAELNQ